MTASALAAAEACAQMAYPAPGCRRCGGEVLAPRLNWCSDECVQWWLDNHSWTDARRAALERDRHRCTRCGSDGQEPAHAVRLIAALTRSHPDGLRVWMESGTEAAALAVVVRLARLHHRLRSVPGLHAYVEELKAQSPLAQSWAAFRRRHRLEVNHIVPRRGRGYGTGCWNHASNLETLCHNCHLTVTAEQRAEQKMAPAA